MATSDTLAVFAVPGMPTASNYATVATRNQHFVMEFDDTTAEACVWRGIMPSAYASGGVDVRLHWTSDATTGDVKWNVSFEAMASQDLDSDGFATAQTATDTTHGTAGRISIATVSFSNGAQMDSVAVGTAFRIKVERDAADAADTMTGDAQLHIVEIREA